MFREIRVNPTNLTAAPVWGQWFGSQWHDSTVNPLTVMPHSNYPLLDKHCVKDADISLRDNDNRKEATPRHNHDESETSRKLVWCHSYS